MWVLRLAKYKANDIYKIMLTKFSKPFLSKES